VPVHKTRAVQKNPAAADFKRRHLYEGRIKRISVEQQRRLQHKRAKVSRKYTLIAIWCCLISFKRHRFSLDGRR